MYSRSKVSPIKIYNNQLYKSIIPNLKLSANIKSKDKNQEISFS